MAARAIASTFVRSVSRGFATAAGTSIATIRRRAPDFSGTAVLNGAFKPVKLSNYAGKWLVLCTYPLDFTFVCPTELTALSDAEAQFKALNAEVLGVSIDSKYTHLAWLNTPRNKGGLGALTFPLLADVTKSVSRDYGVLVEEPTDGMHGVALRGTFIIDPKGVVRSISILDEAVGRSVDEVLRQIAAFQFADKHGEVCPAGWKPGAKTMKADPVKSGEYFSQLK